MINKKILRQGLEVSPNELNQLANLLESELFDTIKKLGLTPDIKEIREKKFQITIVNKEPDCSDTWEIE